MLLCQSEQIAAVAFGNIHAFDSLALSLPLLPNGDEMSVFLCFDCVQLTFSGFYAFFVTDKELTTLWRALEWHCLIAGKLLTLPQTAVRQELPKAFLQFFGGQVSVQCAGLYGVFSV